MNHPTAGRSRFNLSEWALNHQPLTRYLMLVLLVLGGFAYFQLGQDEDPPFNFRAMVVRAYLPGATAQQLLCMHIRGRDDRLSQPNCISQRSRRDLCRIQIGGHIDISRRKIIEQLFSLAKAIDPGDMRADAQCISLLLQLRTIAFAIARHTVRMGCTEHHIKRVWAAP